jgi:DNA invertase Pin-like site-specific DNA recombinase
MKAVIYARYSSDSQREESIEGQLRECTAFAEKNGITVLRHYIDRAYSAKTDNRPEFQNMIKDSGKKLFDIVIVWKLDRFARNRYDSARYKSILKKNGVKVVSATEVISDGAEGIILESVLEGYAEYYSADLSEKVIRGMTDNALKAKSTGGTRPIGYLINNEQRFEIDPLTAPFVLEAYKRYDEGYTLKEIRDWLNDHGVRNNLGKPMQYGSVGHLLKNKRYTGELSYRDVVIPEGIPAIVPLELFDRVQQKMKKNRKAPARHKAKDDYLLTTKLFCGYCGLYMCGESGTSRTMRVHHYYKCVGVKKRKTCKKKSARKQWLEDLVINATMQMVMDDNAIDAIVSKLMELQDREPTALPHYESQLREANIGINNLLNAIQQGILTSSTKQRLEELEAIKEDMEIKIASEQLQKPKVSEDFMRFYLHKFRTLDVTKKEHRKMLVDTFINAIFLYDDKVVITFNYKESGKTITLEDVTSSDMELAGAPKESLSYRGQGFFSWMFLGREPVPGAEASARQSGMKRAVSPMSKGGSPPSSREGREATIAN